jgi:hypothetical protein
MIRGETIPQHLRPEDREIREEETVGDGHLIDALEADFSRHSPEELQLPLLFHTKEQQVPDPCTSLTRFESRLGKICGPVLDALMRVPDIVFAGSAVLAAFLDGSFPPSDLDIFLICEEAGKGEHVLRLIYEALQQSLGSEGRLLALRSNAAITLFRNNGIPVQLVLHVYKSVASLLTGFDVDCCAFAYDPSARKLWCTRLAGNRSVCSAALSFRGSKNN